MPIYLNGSLQYFADVRAANAIIHSASEKSEGGSSSGAMPSAPSPSAGAAAASFNLDACFTMVEAVR